MKNLQSTWGYDFRDGMEVNWDDYGEYATDLFSKRAEEIIKTHDQHENVPLFLYVAHLAVHSANFFNPLQAPKAVVQKFAHITDPNRHSGLFCLFPEHVLFCLNFFTSISLA